MWDTVNIRVVCCICFVFLYLHYSCIQCSYTEVMAGLPRVVGLVPMASHSLPTVIFLSSPIWHVSSGLKHFSLLTIVTWLTLPAVTLKMSVTGREYRGMFWKGTLPVWGNYLGDQSVGFHVASTVFCKECVQWIFTNFTATFLYPEFYLRKFGCVLCAWRQLVHQ